MIVFTKFCTCTKWKIPHAIYLIWTVLIRKKYLIFVTTSYFVFLFKQISYFSKTKLTLTGHIRIKNRVDSWLWVALVIKECLLKPSILFGSLVTSLTYCSRTHSNNSSSNWQQIAWVCLAILWCWRLQG